MINSSSITFNEKNMNATLNILKSYNFLFQELNEGKMGKNEPSANSINLDDHIKQDIETKRSAKRFSYNDNTLKLINNISQDEGFLKYKNQNENEAKKQILKSDLILANLEKENDTFEDFNNINEKEFKSHTLLQNENNKEGVIHIQKSESDDINAKVDTGIFKHKINFHRNKETNNNQKNLTIALSNSNISSNNYQEKQLNETKSDKENNNIKQITLELVRDFSNKLKMRKQKEIFQNNCKIINESDLSEEDSLELDFISCINQNKANKGKDEYNQLKNHYDFLEHMSDKDKFNNKDKDKQKKLFNKELKKDIAELIGFMGKFE